MPMILSLLGTIFLSVATYLGLTIGTKEPMVVTSLVCSGLLCFSLALWIYFVFMKTNIDTLYLYIRNHLLDIQETK